MEINTSYSGSQVTFKLKGRFIFKDYEQWRKALTDAISHEGVSTITVDFEEVEFIDSAAIGMLLVLREEAQENNISVSILNPQGQVEKILELSRMSDLFAISQ